MKTCSAYIRVSTEDQTEYSPDAQLKRIKEFAKSHDMLLLDEHVYIESGISGRTVEKRTEFKRMISNAKAKPKPFDVVLIHAYDRFARNVKESRIYKELLRDDLGIELISITEDFGSGKNAFLMEGIKDILNEYYSLNLRDEVLKGMVEKASRGEVMGGASYGYKIVNKKLEIIEEEANIVKLIFDKYVNSNMALLDIARYLNSSGIKTKHGNMWENRTVKYVLNNPVYIGMIRWSIGKKNYHNHSVCNSSKLITGIHTPIINTEIWDKVQEKLKKNNIFSTPHQTNTNKCWHWLQGLVRCKECGRAYVRNNKTKLRCNGYAKGICSNNEGISIKIIEELILNQIEIDCKTTIDLKISKTKSDEQVEKEILQKKLNSASQRFDRIKEAYINGVDTLEEYKYNKTMIEKEIDNIKEKLSSFKTKKNLNTQEQIKVKLNSISDVLKSDEISMEAKKNAVRSIVKQIVIDTETREIGIEYIESPF